MYATGKGRFHVRAKASIVENATGGSSIVVTEIPYQVKKADAGSHSGPHTSGSDHGNPGHP